MPDDATGADRSAKGDRPGEVVAFPSVRGAQRRASNLPVELSSFVGRQREIAEVKGLLGGTRLLTLTGPGGSGKTRLALAVASDLTGEFEGGAWWVALASLSDLDLVPQAVASALDLLEVPGHSLSETLINHLGSKKVLLVLDNCEHLIEACARLTDALLRACPNLRILVTSREALGVVGEMVWSVPPLSSPDPEHLPPLEELKLYEAVRLFVERARSATASFELTERNASAVARLCRRLEGIPLAIELAAARVRVISVEQISARLEDSFRLLKSESRTADPRQQTLGATIDWSYELLRQDERSLFRRLSVFAGGFGLGAAEAVCVGENIEKDDVLDLLTRLVDKSLVSVEQDTEARYGLLETVRQYGWEKLQESGEAEPARERHARYYLALVEEALKSSEQGAWLKRLEAEHGNFRVALRWTLDSEDSEEPAGLRVELGLRLAAMLGQARFWAAYGLGEGVGWLERGLARSTDSSPEPVRAKALYEAGWIATARGDYGRAIAWLTESLAKFKGLEENTGAAASLALLGQIVVQGGDRERVDPLCEEAEALRRELPDQWVTAHLLTFLGWAAWDRGDHRRAVGLLEEALILSREQEDLYGVALSSGSLGFVVLQDGDPDRAAALFEEGLRALRELKDKVGVFHCLVGSAGVAGSRNQPARAARLWGAAEALGEEFDITILPLYHRNYDNESRLAAARSQLGEAAWEAAWAQGRAMAPEEAIEYTLAIEEEPAAAPLPIAEEDSSTSPTTSYPAGLSAREVEVLKLVARGMANTQIAQDLFISPRTVDRHMGSIYRKLGLGSRVAVARFAAEHGLL